MVLKMILKQNFWTVFSGCFNTNGSKAPRSAYFVICGTLVLEEICGMIISYALSYAIYICDTTGKTMGGAHDTWM